MKVDVYFNFHKKVFSVRHKGRVIDYTKAIMLEGVKFVVNKAGRARVLKEGRKNVHAFVRGMIHEPWVDDGSITNYKSTPVSYNPYRSGNFTDKGGEPVYETYLVYLGLKSGTNKPFITAMEKRLQDPLDSSFYRE